MGPDTLALAESFHEKVIGWQRTIHADPEIGFETHRTAALVAGELQRAGLSVRERIGRTGVLGDIEVPGARRRIAFRADMDALPAEEENDLPHRSRNPGAAHLCGHDAHTAMLLGAASILSAHRDALRCSLRFIFQPNEESLPGGAPGMIEDGCLEGVDRIFGLHMWPLLPTGELGIHPGPTMARPDTWDVRLTGKGGHAATPHENRDPIVAACQIVSALQSVVARNVDPLDSAVLSVTQIHAGSTDNVIPPTVRFGGTVRSFRPEVADNVRARLEQIVRSMASAFETEAELRYTEGYPVLVNDPGVCEEAASILMAEFPISESAAPCLGGEDFAYYLERIPGAFLFLGNRNPEKGITHFCHHPQFQVDEAALVIGVRTWLSLGFGSE